MSEVRPIDANALLKDKVSNAYISRFEIENAPTLQFLPIEAHMDTKIKSLKQIITLLEDIKSKNEKEETS